MEQIAMWIPIILMVLTAILIFRYFRNRKKNEINVRDLEVDEIWKKYRWGLWIIIPVILFFDILSNDMSGAKMNLIPTVLNFFVSKEIILRRIKSGKVSNYPKLTAISVALLVLFVQLVLGYIFWTYLL